MDNQPTPRHDKAPGAPAETERLHLLHDEINARIEGLRHEMLSWVETRLSTLAAPPNVDADAIRREQVRRTLGLRSKRAARFLLTLIDAPERIHNYEDLVEDPDIPITKGIKNSIRVCFSDLRATLRRHGIEYVIHNRNRQGYFISAADAARVQSLWQDAKR